MRIRDLIEAIKELPLRIFEDPKELYRDFIDIRVNKDVQKRLKYFNDWWHEISFVILDGKKIIAACGLQEPPYDKGIYWIKHISVDPEYQGQGLSSRLMQAIYEYAEQHHKRLKHGSFSQSGKERLMPMAIKMNQKYPHVAVDQEFEDW